MARLASAHVPCNCISASPRCTCIAVMMASTPSLFPTCTLLASLWLQRLRMARQPRSCTMGLVGCISIPIMRASNPPLAAMYSLISTSVVARLHSMCPALSCTLPSMQWLVMALTTASIAPLSWIAFCAAGLAQRLESAAIAFSCTSASSAWLVNAFTITGIPPPSIIACWLSSVLLRFQRARQEEAWSWAYCWFSALCLSAESFIDAFRIADRISSMPPFSRTTWRSESFMSRLDKARKECSWATVFPAERRMVSTTSVTRRLELELELELAEEDVCEPPPECPLPTDRLLSAREFDFNPPRLLRDAESAPPRSSMRLLATRRLLVLWCCCCCWLELESCALARSRGCEARYRSAMPLAAADARMAPCNVGSLERCAGLL
mmetsp:Transcript_7492/g.9362  ORF Transcript_7492/g.9362 Transcript_7492/m.9362 type:complete len:381 (-) Transcript_7492:1066-2208(-)